MATRLARAVLTTLAARALSGMLSFLVFAQVVKLLPGPDAARVLFFSFAFGFALATFRAFHLIASAITGREPRSDKLRRVRASAQALKWLALLLAPFVWWLLNAQAVGPGVTAAAVLLVLVCGFDVDLVRAVAGRQPVLPVLTAAGGLAGAALLLWAPRPTVTLCAAAILLQWVPTAGYQLRHGWRLLRPLARVRRVVASSWARVATLAGSLLMAVYDGAVISAPFLLVLSLPAVQAVDLALGNRLFVASLALYSLIGNWVVSGDIERLSRRLQLSPAATFGGSQFFSAAVIGGIYAVLYAVVSRQVVSLTSGLIFIATLTAFVTHTTAIRYTRARESRVQSSALYALTLGVFYAAMLALKTSPQPSLAVIVTCVFAALATPALLQFALARRSS
ncbi:MAG: hypothetical protein M3Y32_13110 [Pseudomonadota bacterium]|nr:hypothetical protein [Pseudomonadota bacterium]